jgi:uncharacterized protein
MLNISPEEIVETLLMITQQNLDVRTVTLGLSLEHCADEDLGRMAEKVYDSRGRSCRATRPRLRGDQRRVRHPDREQAHRVTPIAQLASACRDADVTPLAEALDRAAPRWASTSSAASRRSCTKAPATATRGSSTRYRTRLRATERVCSSVNVASTRAGINMDAVLRMAEVIKETAEATADRDSFGCGKLVVFSNMVEDNPFMAGAMHGAGEPDAVINVGISGPGVVRAVVSALPDDADLTAVAEAIKATAFKITRAGELFAREAARRLGVEMGIVDLSLAPTPAEGDSVADIIEAIGVERCGGPGTTTALALLNDAVKKGGAMGTSSIGGLSGAFIPVSEDAGMMRAVEDGALTLEKLEAMTSVCSVGLDMIASRETRRPRLSPRIIADACAIGVINSKTTATRLIPAAGKSVGDTVEYGGLFGGRAGDVGERAGRDEAHPQGRTIPGAARKPELAGARTRARCHHLSDD